jgi:hypothetical protein
MQHAALQRGVVIRKGGDGYGNDKKNQNRDNVRGRVK